MRLSPDRRRQVRNLKRLARALEAGKYTQCRGALQDDRGRVCILGAAYSEFNWSVSDVNFNEHYGDFDHLPSEMSYVYGNGRSMVALNDAKGWTFPMFAALLYDYTAAVEAGGLP